MARKTHTHSSTTQRAKKATAGARPSRSPEIEALRSQVEELKGISREAGRLRRQQKRHQGEIEKLRAESAQRLAEAGAHKRENAALRESRDADLREIAAGQAEIARLRDEHPLATPVADGDGLQERIAATERIVAARDDEISGLRTSLAATQETISARDDEIAALETIRSLEQRQIALRNREIEELRAALGERDATIDRASEEATALRAEIAGLRGVKAAREAEFASRDREIRRLEAILDGIDQAIATRRDGSASPKDRPEGRPIPEPAAKRPADTGASADLPAVKAPPAPAPAPAAPAVTDPAARGTEIDAVSQPTEKLRIFPWIRRPVSPTQAPPAPAAQTPELGAPTSADPDADPRRVSDIHGYWRRGQIRAKLAWPGIDDVDDFFLHYVLEMCREHSARTVRILSAGTGNRDFEVHLARRALDSGVRNFELHCLSPTASALTNSQAIAAEPSLAEHLTLVQCELHRFRPANPFDLCIANQSLQHQSDLEAAVLQIAAALDPEGALVVNSPIERLDCLASPVAREIVDQIWPLMPDRYKFDCELETRPSRFAADRTPAPPAERRAPQILPLLLKRFHFEVFVAFGNVINAFVDGEIGPNFESANERDRSFIDRIATLDDAKIDAGLLPPTHLLAALRLAPVASPVVYRHWTPEFCLGRRGRPTDESRAAGATPPAV